jgi:hypothetical protein
MKRIYLLIHRNPTIDEVENLKKNFKDIEMVKSSTKVELFWEDVCFLTTAMSCDEFCKGITEIIKDTKRKKADIAWIEGNFFARKIVYQELKALNIPVIYSIHGYECEKRENLNGDTVVIVKGDKFIRFEYENG